MSHGGGGQPSCTAVPFGKYVRRTIRAALGMKKKPKKKKKPNKELAAAESASMERTMRSFSSEAETTKESVVRVVLKSGVVEAYPGVVLACTVIRNHPPGLCLAYPDVFRNPHGAVVRPLEPLFPGQKFLLLPETTVIRLKQKIPESSTGAFADDDQDYSGGTTPSSEEEEEVVEVRDAVAAGDDGGFVARCNARDFYVANDRWSKCQFKQLVHPVEHHQPERNAKKNGKKRKGKTKKRNDRRVPAPAGFRMLTTPRKMWEPSLPSVVEAEDEDDCSSTRNTPNPNPNPNPNPIRDSEHER